MSVHSVAILMFFDDWIAFPVSETFPNDPCFCTLHNSSYFKMFYDVGDIILTTFLLGILNFKFIFVFKKVLGSSVFYVLGSIRY